MTIDISRRTFDPQRHTAWTTTMQGRVATDAPVNEDRTLRDRRLRALMTHLIGRVGYPATQPDSFLIGLSGGMLTIGPGTMYVDGHPAENFGLVGPGDEPLFDDILSELRGADPVPFDQQPYFPGVVPDPPEDGTHLIYLDVWQRDVTFLTDPSILDPGIPTDTFARRQTVWQVRSIGPVAGVDCETPDEDIPGWSALIAPSAARLSTRANPTAFDPDPCLLPPDAGFRGTDNRTYLFQVHDLAADGTPLVKFSRVNGVVATTILARPQADVIEVAEVAKDDFLRFNPGDWVEVTDEVRVLTAEPGVIARVLSVDDPSNSITFEAALPAGAIRLVGVGPEADQAFRPVVRRWGQAGEIRDETGTVVVDLDALGADGLVPAPTDGTFLHLGDGVEAALTIAAAGGEIHRGDAWSFIARFADSSVEELAAAPPQDFQHHYCRLAMAEAAGGVWTEVTSDCRDPIDEECCCTVVVRPGEDIQAAIDSLPDDVGGCICLKPGEHVVTAMLAISTPNVTIHGECHGASVRLDGDGPVLRVDGTLGTEIHTIAFSHRSAEGAGILEIVGSEQVAVASCGFSAIRGTGSAGILLADATSVTVRDCRVAGTVLGIVMPARCEDIIVVDNALDLGGEGFDGQIGVAAPNAIGAIVVTGNRISGALTGISLNDDPTGQNRSSLAAGSLIADNRILLQPREAGAGDDTAMHGIDSAADATVIRGNKVRFAGSARAGIRATGTGLGITENTVEAESGDGDRNLGILVGVPEDTPHLTRGVTITDNALRGMTTALFLRDATEVSAVGNDLRPTPAPLQPAIAMQGLVGARVAGNSIEDGGIVSTDGRLTVIESNTIARGAFGIGIGTEFGASVRGNRVAEAGTFGILALQCLARTAVVENQVTNAGATGNLPFAIGALLVVGEWHVEANEVMNTGVPTDGQANAAPAVGIIGVLVLEARVESNLVTYSNLDLLPDGREDRALVLQGLLEVAFIFADRRVTFGFPCQIGDNKFIGKGNRALVELRQTVVNDNVIIRFDRVFFTHNYCLHVGGVQGAGNASVILDGSAGVVMGNQVKALSLLQPSMNLGGMPGTVVGNITWNGIANHPNFPTPEASFNRII